MPMRRRGPALVLALLLALPGPGLSAQTITGMTVHRPGYLLNTAGGGGTISNAYVTSGTNPVTDAFLYNGNATGFFGGLSLNPGLNTFHVWGAFNTLLPSSTPNVMLNLFANSDDTTPVLSAIFGTNGFVTGSGVTAFQNVESFSTTTGAGLTWAVGGKQVTIKDWSSAMVNRAVSVASFGVTPTLAGVDHYTGKLVLEVTDIPNTTVPEPGTWGLMSAGLAGVWLVARRRRAVAS